MTDAPPSGHVDVRYWYDVNPPPFTTVPSKGGGVLDWATGVQDRAHCSAIAYDARGNVVWTARQPARRART